MDHLSVHPQSTGVSPRSSSRSFIPLRRLNTINEARSTGEQPHSPPPEVDVLDETGPGSVARSSLRGRKAPVPAPRRQISDQVDGDEDSGDAGESEEAVRPPQLPPPRGWVPENQDPGDNVAGNPLLRHSSQGSRGSGRS